MPKKSNTPPISATKTARQRAAWLLLLFLVTGTIAYPDPANWLIGQVNRIAGTKFGDIHMPFVLGLDLQGGTHLEYEADVSKVAPADRKESLNGVRDVIERRVNTLGVSEPLVQTTQNGDSWRVTVELAGIKDINQAINLIGETPILQFKEPNDVTSTPPLTADQQKQLSDANTKEKALADKALAAALKPDADFSGVLASLGDLGGINATTSMAGFIKSNENASEIYNLGKNAATGTVLNKVFDVPNENAYLVAKVVARNDAAKEVEGAHILISYQGAKGGFSTLTKDEALAKIKELQKAATPQNFADLAKKNSQEPGAADSAGDLGGWVSPDTFVQPFADEIAGQKPGTISDVVETEYGYHLIYKKAERIAPDISVQVIAIHKTAASDIQPPADQWKDTELTGKQLQSAKLEYDQRLGTVQVALQFDDEGAKLFQDITKRNVGKQVAIFLDGQIISDPVVQQEIIGGKAVITGSGDVTEAQTLARRLNAGALPVPIKLIAQQTVGPTLGADSLQRSLAAGFAGFALVALFMILIYRLPGVTAIAALFLYAALSATAFKLIPITLSLPGIAGFILSIGIAVDANVLVFERLKEELKVDHSLSVALEDSFKRAWPSIRDGHVTVLISCAVLFWFTSSIIKGFALTLGVGTAISLFTAVVTCRTMLRYVSSTRLAKNNWLFLKKSAKSE
ncbi:MAG TPA: protein translocase subunit SecD [Verrucomicrobiae bacterium]|nr:protein translocase subunit SecD [Verrucomicrobiae bacterium]